VAEDVASVPLQSPMIGMDMTEDVALYVGILQGTVAALVVNECKYRAFLELLTGEPWEATRIDMKGEVLQKLAVDSLVKQTGMAPDRAKLLVAQRWDTRNQPAPVIVPVAVPTSEFADAATSEAASSAIPVPEMKTRVQVWRERQKTDAANVTVPETSTNAETSTAPKE